MKTNQIFRSLLLHILAIIFVVLNLSSFSIVNLAKIMPLFDLMAVFYFAFFRKIYAIWFLFLLGLWHDAITGGILGLTSLLYIMLVKLFATINNRLFLKENFNYIWYQFIVFSALYLLLKWSALMLLNGQFYSFLLPFIQWLMAISLYVIMHKFFDYLSVKMFGDAARY